VDATITTFGRAVEDVIRTIKHSMPNSWRHKQVVVLQSRVARWTFVQSLANPLNRKCNRIKGRKTHSVPKISSPDECESYVHILHRSLPAVLCRLDCRGHELVDLVEDDSCQRRALVQHVVRNDAVAYPPECMNLLLLHRCIPMIRTGYLWKLGFRCGSINHNNGTTATLPKQNEDDEEGMDDSPPN